MDDERKRFRDLSLQNRVFILVMLGFLVAALFVDDPLHTVLSDVSTLTIIIFGLVFSWLDWKRGKKVQAVIGAVLLVALGILFSLQQ